MTFTMDTRPVCKDVNPFKGDFVCECGNCKDLSILNIKPNILDNVDYKAINRSEPEGVFHSYAYLLAQSKNYYWAGMKCLEVAWFYDSPPVYASSLEENDRIDDCLDEHPVIMRKMAINKLYLVDRADTILRLIMIDMLRCVGSFDEARVQTDKVLGDRSSLEC